MVNFKGECLKIGGLVGRCAGDEALDHFLRSNKSNVNQKPRVSIRPAIGRWRGPNPLARDVNPWRHGAPRGSCTRPQTPSLTHIAKTAAVVAGRRLSCGLSAPLLAGGMDPSQIQEAHYFSRRYMHAWFNYQPPSLSLLILHTFGISTTTCLHIFV